MHYRLLSCMMYGFVAEVDTLGELTQKLDAYLSVNKMSKRQLAAELGISINTLDKWWRHREPSAGHAEKIRQLLQQGVSATATASPEAPTAPAVKTATEKVVIRQLPKPPQNFGKRYEEKSTVVSLLRTTCPFCQKAIEKFRHCTKCGQHFVWANVPVGSKPSQ